MALEYGNKKLGLLMIIVLIAFPYAYSETISNIIPKVYADPSVFVGPNYPNTVSSAFWSTPNGATGSSVGTCTSISGKGGNGRTIDFTGFGIHIPVTSIITGIQ